MKKHYLSTTLLAAAAGMTFASTGHAQSVDALLDKLVDKGVLTMKEASELKDESDKNFNTALSAKNGMSDWVSALKFNGDIRARYENFNSCNSLFTDRNRYRYRVRFGVVANLADDFEAGFKLTSSDPPSGGGFNGSGDPISGNSTFQDNGSKKLIFIDQVYGKWSPLKGPNWTGSLIVGKMENPFLLSDLVFDPDYTPEGAAFQLGYAINDKHTVRMNSGVFALDELGGSGNDPYLLGGQIRWDAAWTPKLLSTMGVAGLALSGDGQLTTAAVPNINRGNARTAGGALVYGYESVVVDASVTYMLDSAPFYAGPCPIKIGGDYMVNEEAPRSARNCAYSAGITLGKSGKKNTWDLSYTWKYLGANAWYEELVDSDFGAYYVSDTPAQFSGLGTPGYASGTNVKGHVVKFSYSPSDSITLSAKWFLTELIDPSPLGSNSEMSRLQVDALWKF